jgi:hypothetical protein
MAFGGIVRELVNKIGFQVDNSGAKRAENQFTRLQNMSRNLSEIAGGFFSGFMAKGIVSNLLSITNQFEQLDVAFTTMLDSQEKSNKLMQDMQNFAKVTPFTITDVTIGAKQLLAYGIELENIIPEMKTLGDVASGISMPLGDLVYLYGTLRSQGRALGLDIRQFANRGIPIREELAKILKIDITQLDKFITEGKVGFKEVQKAFQNMTSEGGKFYNLMFKQSKTIGGIWSNFKDAVTFMLKDIGNQLLPFFKMVLNNMLKIFNYLNEKISPRMKAILLSITVLTAAIIPLLVLIGLINVKLLPVYGTILLIAGIAALIGLAFDEIYTYIKGGKSLIGEWIPPFETLRNLVKNIHDFLFDIGKIIANLQFGNLNEIKNIFKDIENIFKNITGNDFFKFINDQLNNLPRLSMALTPPGIGLAIAKPLFTAKRQEFESKQQLNKVNNTIHSTVNITVPIGTQKSQADYLKRIAEDQFTESLNIAARKIIASKKGKE